MYLIQFKNYRIHISQNISGDLFHRELPPTKIQHSLAHNFEINLGGREIEISQWWFMLV